MLVRILLLIVVTAAVTCAQEWRPERFPIGFWSGPPPDYNTLETWQTAAGANFTFVGPRGGFTVEDRDRSQGVYFVRYIDPEIEGGRAGKKPGFLSRLFGSEARAEASPRFRIEVRGEGDRSVVQVRDPQGQPVGEVDRKTVARILSLLQEQMK